jgi:hypothetical protein
MFNFFRPAFRLSLIIFIVSLLLAASAEAGVKFKVKLDPAMVESGQTVSGRLLIFMTREQKPLQMIEPSFTDPESVWITGMEVKDAAPGKTIWVDADELSFPRDFSAAPRGEYQIMALLDADHSYTYDGAGEGDIYSTVKKVNMPDGETDLTLSNKISEQQTAIPINTYMVNFESPTL